MGWDLGSPRRPMGTSECLSREDQLRGGKSCPQRGQHHQQRVRYKTAGGGGEAVLPTCLHSLLSPCAHLCRHFHYLHYTPTSSAHNQQLLGELPGIQHWTGLSAAGFSASPAYRHYYSLAVQVCSMSPFIILILIFEITLLNIPNHCGQVIRYCSQKRYTNTIYSYLIYLSNISN